MSSSPFAIASDSSSSLNRQRSGSITQLNSAAHTSVPGFSSAKSPFSPAIQSGSRGALSHAGSPARAAITMSGTGFSPGSLQHNVPSPATFANIAAAVGVQNPLEESTRSSESNGLVGGATKVQDPYAELLSNVESFLTVQVAQLEAAGNLFFDEYDASLNDQADSNKVVEAHRTLMATYDRLLHSSAQLGIAAIPCPPSELTLAARASTLEQVHSRLRTEARETFERREALRESASMVTSILIHDQKRKPT